MALSELDVSPPEFERAYYWREVLDEAYAQQDQSEELSRLVQEAKAELAGYEPHKGKCVVMEGFSIFPEPDPVTGESKDCVGPITATGYYDKLTILDISTGTNPALHHRIMHRIILSEVELPEDSVTQETIQTRYAYFDLDSNLVVVDACDEDQSPDFKEGFEQSHFSSQYLSGDSLVFRDIVNDRQFQAMDAEMQERLIQDFIATAEGRVAVEGKLFSGAPCHAYVLDELGQSMRTWKPSTVDEVLVGECMGVDTLESAAYKDWIKIVDKQAGLCIKIRTDEYGCADIPPHTTMLIPLSNQDFAARLLESTHASM